MGVNHPGYAQSFYVGSPGAGETPEQRIAREEAGRAALDRIQVAQSKAEALLMSGLTQEQKHQLSTHGYFEVRIGRETYRIYKGRSGNVKRVRGGREIERFCIHPRESCPDFDTMLAQKLLLETDEQTFLMLANRTPIFN